ncbi:MAG TPA: hypothetical protein PKD64_06085 [Pirellulaceae bacterium]|nr:hypothetical protein [Pirellulaceae bacterium]HMO91749.1 hypothetical protein [Pirellulaceae bacterium]HMP69548.1 hypothetical protein [Pirellulaceae bacterium]
MSVVNVICMKWGTKYNAAYVNTLYSMVRRHLHRPFRFVCLTDDSQGFNDGIDVFPLIKLNIGAGPERGWDKLTTFSNPLYDLSGPALFLDLDVVIVDSIDCFFEHPGEFLIIKDWVKRDLTGNSSVYRFQVNSMPDILENFRTNHTQIKEQVRNEQEYLSQYVAAQGRLDYWPDEWCRSFKYHCNQPGFRSWFSPPVCPPQAKIIVFHGTPNPPDAIRGRSGKWYRRILPTSWVAENWK